MSLTQLECPECGKVLKPARPVTPGKKVRCPKCEAVFVAAGDTEGIKAEKDEDGPRKKKAGPAAKTKPDDKKASAEEEEEGAYGLIRDSEEDEANRPKIKYAPDTSVKDLRGPAVATLTNPTNWLIRSGFIGVFGCLVLLLLLGIPALLPVTEESRPEARQPLPMLKIDKGFAKGGEQQQGGGGAGGGGAGGGAAGGGGGGGGGEKKEGQAKIEEPPSFGYRAYGYDWGSLCDLHWSLFLVVCIPFILLGCYSAAVAAGGIKAQNLESRGWGMASSIMAMIPLNTFCPIIALTIIFQCALYMVLDATDDLAIFMVRMWLLLCHLLYALSLGSGIWTLVTLNKPEVLAGFEYKGE